MMTSPSSLHPSLQVLEQLNSLLPALLDSLSASSEPVVVAALGVLAAIAACPHQFRPVLVSLLDRFRGETGTQLLQVRLVKGKVPRKPHAPLDPPPTARRGSGDPPPLWPHGVREGVHGAVSDSR